MEPFSIAVGALGITEFAISSIVQLRDFINGLAEAKEVVQDIASNLDGIARPLDALKKLSISDGATSTAAKDDLEKAGVAEAVNRCGKACDEFIKDLKKWTKHSSTKKFALRDRFSVGVWNKEKIRTFRTRVESCEAIVQFAVASTQLLVQLRAENLSETDREDLKKQLQTLETKIQEHLDLTRKQQYIAEKRWEELQKEPDDEEDDGAQRELAIQQVENQSRVLVADQISCGVVFSRLRSKRTGQDIGKVITSDDSTALVGLPESVVGKINQRVGDVETKERSKAAIGVFPSSMSMEDFFKDLLPQKVGCAPGDEGKRDN